LRSRWEGVYEQHTEHVQRGFGSVRPYLYGPRDLPAFLEKTFGAMVLESNPDGPTLLQIGDSLIWAEAGDLPESVTPWVGSVYVYVADVDGVYARAIELGAKTISAPEDKPYKQRQAGFVDAGGNTWWVSTYTG
jgi:PhnB protein